MNETPVSGICSDPCDDDDGDNVTLIAYWYNPLEEHLRNDNTTKMITLCGYWKWPYPQVDSNALEKMHIKKTLRLFGVKR